MKKTLLVLSLSVVLMFALGSMAMAADTTQARGNGFMFSTQDMTPEARLAAKVERIDALVEKGQLSAEEAANFKKVISERMAACPGDGSARETNERLGIGFGRLNGGRGMNRTAK